MEVIFEKEHIRTFDPKCEVMLAIMSSLAQEESRSMSENIRWGIRKNMQDGKVSLPYKRFLGYQKGPDGRPEIVEKEAEIVRRIYDLFLKGNSLSHIARIMTDCLISTPGGTKNWTATTVQRILANEKYKGEALLQKTYTADYLTKKVRKNNGEVTRYLVHHSHAPIIDPVTFERVQRELVRRRRARTKKAGTSSPFSNRLVCGACGAFYGHKVWRSRGKTAKRLSVWCCNHRYTNETKCPTPILRESEIRAAFEEILRKLEYVEQAYSDTLWYELVEEVTIYEDRQAGFHLANGKVITTKI